MRIFDTLIHALLLNTICMGTKHAYIYMGTKQTYMRTKHAYICVRNALIPVNCLSYWRALPIRSKRFSSESKEKSKEEW